MISRDRDRQTDKERERERGRARRRNAKSGGPLPFSTAVARDTKSSIASERRKWSWRGGGVVAR